MGLGVVGPALIPMIPNIAGATGVSVTALSVCSILFASLLVFIGIVR